MMKEFMKEIKEQVKDELFEKLDEQMINNDKTKELIEKKIKIKNKIEEISNYIEDQLNLIEGSFLEFKNTFKIDKVKIEADIIASFACFSNLENELISMYMRNNKYYSDVQKIEKILSSIIIKAYKYSGITIPNKTKDFEILMQNDETWVEYQNLIKKFKTWFENYQELADKIKNKNYMMKSYIDFLKFSRGND